MDVDLQELQRKSVMEMLQLPTSDTDYNDVKTWKMLIYDEESRQILSPIIKIGELRHQGVTLNMSINDKRGAVPTVDAVYLITPSEKNIDMIINDAREKKYGRIHINFTTFTSDTYLSDLAKKFVEKNAFNAVASVTDRYLHFVAISPLIFSLNMPSSFQTFYGNVTEEMAAESLDILVDRLLSIIVTTATLPIIRSPRITSPASTVAEKLNKKLFDLISTRNQLDISLSSSHNRPLLIILDRNIDIFPMIQHSWNYQPLLHDLYGIDYNKVTITTEKSQKKNSFDLENNDKIYQSISAMPLSEVATYISTSLETYNSQISQINKGESSNAGNLVNAINAIPQLTEQKRLLDMHTNIATALVDNVKERDIDRFYEFEYDLDIMYDKNCIQNFDELIKNKNATPMDKYRSLLAMALHKPTISDEKLDEYEKSLKADGGINMEALKGLRNIMKMREFSTNILKHIQTVVTSDSSSKTVRTEHNANNTPKKEVSQSHKKLANYSSKILDTGLNIFKGVRNLLPRKKNLHIVNLVEKLINNMEDISDDFVSYDPKVSENVIYKQNKRVTSRRCIVFVVGGASYNEAIAMTELAAKIKQTIIYGSTFFDRPEDFVHQLGSSNF
ncbi:Sec1 family domain-containing protein [Theileria equi strain WA]|uniref:Sec1 family domain-containing protein n=1 Tax=Theileria equi strain WA TaxID=1537102 RepID=L0B1I3_THEEQ|nr:Sec1 family domain-containing protein [Theileria equi strain WA]AFZ81111.1 Sec1 family domain-containing protein [Theileria equi strain WA]|eukprot:XP_004830777.1 Sec1 family domain-containing protein [Theileria equi strain WA]